MITEEKKLKNMEIGQLLDEGDFMVKRVYQGWIYYDKNNSIAVYVPEVFNAYTQ